MGKFIDGAVQAMDLTGLTRASDAPYPPLNALQEHLFGLACSMFGLVQTITSHHLTNTLFEGVAVGVSTAKAGRRNGRVCESQRAQSRFSSASPLRYSPSGNSIVVGWSQAPSSLCRITALTPASSPAPATIL